MKQNFYINKFEGQLGNQLLAYNNLCQLSYPDGNVSITENSEIPKYFKNINTFSGKKKGLEINGKIIRKCKKYNKIDIILIPPYLGESFFYLTEKNPNIFLELKDGYKVKIDNNKTNISIHLRMPSNTTTDSYKAKKHAYFRNTEYIKRAIILCLEKFDNCNFIIFGAPTSEHFSIQLEREVYRTMDNFHVYSEILNYLKSNNIPWEHSITMKDPNKSYIYDFSQMSECDVIIANPSTFNICATFLGKKNKKVIYLKEFLDIASKHNDLFWVDLKKGGNEFYNIWKLI